MEAASDQKLRWVARGGTDVGRKRPHNEDTILVADEQGLFAVADGMGGHAAGEVASRTAIQTLHQFVSYAQTDNDFTWPFGVEKSFSMAENVLLTAVHLANRKVCQMAGEHREFAGMGTTLAVVYLAGGKVQIAHVGDSRIYRLREGRFEGLTIDHSWVNEQLQRHIITEDEARNHRWRNVITRALGNRVDLEVDMQALDIQAGDLFLICSDGLTGMLRDEVLHDALRELPAQASGEALEATCQGLIAAANEAGGVDNISVIVIQVQAA